MSEKLTKLERKIEAQLTRTLKTCGNLGGWEPDALASWLVPGMLRIIKRETGKL